MRDKIAITLAFMAILGALFFVQRSERQGHEYQICVPTREARKQGNVRATHLLLLEAAVINSNHKAQKEIPGYHYPEEITQLEEEPKVEPLPAIKC